MLIFLHLVHSFSLFINPHKTAIEEACNKRNWLQIIHLFEEYGKKYKVWGTMYFNSLKCKAKIITEQLDAQRPSEKLILMMKGYSVTEFHHEGSHAFELWSYRSLLHLAMDDEKFDQFEGLLAKGFNPYVPLKIDTFSYAPFELIPIYCDALAKTETKWFNALKIYNGILNNAIYIVEISQKCLDDLLNLKDVEFFRSQQFQLRPDINRKTLKRVLLKLLNTKDLSIRITKESNLGKVLIETIVLLKKDLERGHSNYKDFLEVFDRLLEIEESEFHEELGFDAIFYDSSVSQ
eukprot:NODE_103_length_19640_cov_0.520905.p5 type:complete len:292 gc:universal NODE_103_length_19640_cov_0.520905:15108-14233(-)